MSHALFEEEWFVDASDEEIVFTGARDGIKTSPCACIHWTSYLLFSEMFHVGSLRYLSVLLTRDTRSEAKNINSEVEARSSHKITRVLISKLMTSTVDVAIAGSIAPVVERNDISQQWQQTKRQRTRRRLVRDRTGVR